MRPGNAHLGIVVGVDDSPAAKVAVYWAARDAELRNIPLTLVHALSPNMTTWLDTQLLPRDWRDGRKTTGADYSMTRPSSLQKLAGREVPLKFAPNSCRRRPFPRWSTCPKTHSWW